VVSFQMLATYREPDGPIGYGREFAVKAGYVININLQQSAVAGEADQTQAESMA